MNPENSNPIKRRAGRPRKSNPANPVVDNPAPKELSSSQPQSLIGNDNLNASIDTPKPGCSFMPKFETDKPQSKPEEFRIGATNSKMKSHEQIYDEFLKKYKKYNKEDESNNFTLIESFIFSMKLIIANNISFDLWTSLPQRNQVSVQDFKFLFGALMEMMVKNGLIFEIAGCYEWNVYSHFKPDATILNGGIPSRIL